MRGIVFKKLHIKTYSRKLDKNYDELFLKYNTSITLFNVTAVENESTVEISVSDPYHFDADPDPRIRFWDDGSGSGSGYGSGSDLKSNKFQFFS